MDIHSSAAPLSRPSLPPYTPFFNPDSDGGFFPGCCIFGWHRPSPEANEENSVHKNQNSNRKGPKQWSLLQPLPSKQILRNYFINYYWWIYNHLCETDVVEDVGAQLGYDVDEVIRRPHHRYVGVHLRETDNVA